MDNETNSTGDIQIAPAEEFIDYYDYYKNERWKLSYSQFPIAIKKRIETLLKVSGILILCGICAVIAKVANLWIFLSIGCIDLVFLSSALMNYINIRNNKYICFSGIIVDFKLYGFLNADKYYVVKVSNGKKLLNFVQHDIATKIKIGMPFTAYLLPDAEIKSTELGPTIYDTILITYSGMNDSKVDNNIKTASDFLNSETTDSDIAEYYVAGLTGTDINEHQ